MRMLLFFILLFGIHHMVYSKPIDGLLQDTSSIELRTINATALNKLKESKDFQYVQMQEPPVSWWDRFWSWFWWKIGQILSTRRGRITFWTVLTIVSIGIIGYFAVKVSGMNKGGLFARKANGSLNYTEGEEDIHNISFDEAIQAAINQKNYRLAVRLLYLHTLKTLSDKAYITWQINKTNSDYLDETKDKPWNNLLKSITLSFEYTWYGEINIELKDFTQMQLQFQQLKTQLL